MAIVRKKTEICAVKIHTNSLTMCIITIYRAPSGNFTYFLQRLDNVLKFLNTPSTRPIICGDLNINCLVESDQKRLLDNLLLMYNLRGIVDFPTRITHANASAIDNIIIDMSQFDNYSVNPFANDLSDHDAQILTIKIPVHRQTEKVKSIRKVDKYTIPDFIYKLSNESWVEVFNYNDIDLMFNSFLNTYLRIFYSGFCLIRNKSRKNGYDWLTLGIKTSCKYKRELFLLLQRSNNPALKQHYKHYCKILSKVMKEATRMTTDERILKSNNIPKTTWTLINELLRKQHTTHDIQKLTIHGNLITNQHSIADAFNKYFSSIIDITNNHSSGNRRQEKISTCKYLDQHPGDPLVFKLSSTQEIISIIKSLNKKILLVMMKLAPKY